MGQYPRLRTVLTVVLVVLVFAMIALIDVSRWPPRTRFYLVRKTPPPPMARWRPPLHRPAAKPGPPVPAQPIPGPAVEACTPDRIGSSAPGGAAAPEFRPVGYRPVALVPGRGYLEGSDPTPSPDGREVAFVKEGEDGRSHIWISGVDGTRLRPLTSGLDLDPNSSREERDPAWSPDGSRIAFTTGGGLWLINPDGTGLRRLPPIAGYLEFMAPAWSPDGARLAVVARSTDRSRDIWIMNADGSGMRRMTEVNGYVGDPAFSPDGRQIVFVSTAEGGPVRFGRHHLTIMNVDGKGLCRLTSDNADDANPSWSPQGIVFQRECCRLWWIPAARPTTIFSLLQDEQGSSPAWVKGGASVVYESSDGHIFTFDLGTRTITPLTQVNVLELTIYIKPGLKNTIRPKTEGPIPVAILSAPWFDPVRRLDRRSIRFGPEGAGRPAVSCAAQEINDDGVPDLVCRFDVGAAFSEKQREGVLTAAGRDGLRYEGRDAVEVVY